MDDKYCNLTDEELIKSANSGDNDARTALLVRYKSTVRAVTRPFFLIGGDGDDILQEGMIGLNNAISSFNGTSSFKSFATLCIKRSVISAIKRTRSEKHSALNNSISLSEVLGTSFEGEIHFNDKRVVDPEKEYIHKEETQELKNAVKKKLSVLEYEILSYYLEGFSYAEISTRTGRNHKAIDNALTRIKKKLENII